MTGDTPDDIMESYAGDDSDRDKHQGLTTDIHVSRHRNHTRQISVYDRYGRAGDISLTVGEAEFVRDRLNEVLGDE